MKETRLTQNGFSFAKVDPENFQINKFFYKNVGKKHHWVDRLVWTDKNWIDYTTDNKVKTFIVKKHDDLVGYFELIYHEEQNEDSEKTDGYKTLVIKRMHTSADKRK